MTSRETDEFGNRNQSDSERGHNKETTKCINNIEGNGVNSEITDAVGIMIKSKSCHSLKYSNMFKHCL